MSAKRRADNQMTREDLDRDDSPELDSTLQIGIQIASKEVLATRVIKTARRSLPHTEQDSKPSPFAALKTGSYATNFSAFSGISAKPPDVLVSNSASLTNTNGKNNKAKDVDDEEFDRNKEYYSKLKNLNKTFQSWVSDYMAKGPYFDFSNVCNEYINYHKKIVDQYPLIETKKQEKIGVSSGLSNTFSSSSNLFTPKASLNLTPAITLNNNPSPLKPAVTQASTNLFTSTPNPLFNFKPVATTIMNNEQAPNTENENDDNYEPPKPEAVVIEEEGAVFSKQDIKLFYKQPSDQSYVTYGKGTLYIKELNGGKKQLIFRAGNTLGTILLNISWVNAIPVSLKKKDVIFAAFANPPINNKDNKQLVSYIMRSRNEDEAKELSETLIKYKSQ